MNGWYDAEEFTPHVVCEVELSNGERLLARFVCGDWETLEGKVIYPVRFRPKSITVDAGFYTFREE